MRGRVKKCFISATLAALESLRGMVKVDTCTLDFYSPAAPKRFSLMSGFSPDPTREFDALMRNAELRNALEPFFDDAILHINSE